MGCHATDRQAVPSAVGQDWEDEAKSNSSSSVEFCWILSFLQCGQQGSLVDVEFLQCSR